MPSHVIIITNLFYNDHQLADYGICYSLAFMFNLCCPINAKIIFLDAKSKMLQYQVKGNNTLSKIKAVLGILRRHNKIFLSCVETPDL